MSFVKGANGEKVIPVKIDGIAQELDMSRLIPVNSNIQNKIIHYAQSATPELAAKAAESSLLIFSKWKKTTNSFKRDLLFRAAAAIEAREAEFMEFQVAETSCSEEWAKLNARATAQGFREIASSISYATTGELPRLETPGAYCLVFQEPIGPVLAISPWNASMALCGRALAAPIAAGCSVVFKASELCPRVHHYMVQTLEDAGMPKGLVNVIQAAREDGPVITEAIIANKAIRKVEFTGSALVGSIIGQIASKYLKPVLMELGGKAPVIVLKDADIEFAAEKIVFGAMLHHGQICMSTDRIIVVEDVAETLTQAIKVYIEKNYANGAGYAVNKRIAKRSHDLLQKAKAGGAKFLVGDGSLNATGSALLPTIITDVTQEDEIFDEEIFGPAAILIKVKDEDEAVKVANEAQYGLIAAVHSQDIIAALRVARQVEAGQVHIGNITEFEEANTPIGGRKASGWGRNNGKYALREFLVEKTITVHDPATTGAGKYFDV